MREVEHPLRDDAPVSDYDDGISVDRSELGAKFFVGFNAVRLSDRKAQPMRGLFHRGCDQFEATPLGAVGLSDYEMDAVACDGESLQRRDGETRSAAEDKIERHFVIL